MQRRIVVLSSALATLTAAAQASPPDDDDEPPEVPMLFHPDAEECESTYPARLADAKRAIHEHRMYEIEYARAMPWFFEHCRMLSSLERAIRKIDDPAAFVCDTKKGRPRELTTRYVATHSAPLGLAIFMRYAHADDECEAHDLAAGRPSLVIRDEAPAHLLEVLCWQSSTPRCDRARAVIAKVRAREASR